ncbi:MAG TPA: DUF99 family protein [Candidatus Acidoferrum sp.]|nr:DUF99 family protein [Candidatus Acidoferrum sp.]
MIKKEIRVLGIASASPRRDDASTHVVGVVYRGNRWLEGVMRTVAPRDQLNLTSCMARMVTKSPHFPQLRLIVLDELFTKSGSYIDIEALSRNTGLPVMAVLAKKIPIKHIQGIQAGNRRAFKASVGLPCMRWRPANKTYFVYSAGSSGLMLDELLKVCASREGLPEAARVARIAAVSLERLFLGRVP